MDDYLNSSDMEASGYEGDTDDGGDGEENSDSSKQLDDTVICSQLLKSVTQYLVPQDVRKPVKLWAPVLYCVELLRESVDKMEQNWWVAPLSPWSIILVYFL